MGASWGEARAQVIALRSEILERLARGDTARSIYADLTEAGKIHTKERIFYYHVARLRDEARRQPVAASGAARSQSQSPSQSPVQTRTVEAAIPRLPSFSSPATAPSTKSDVNQSLWDGDLEDEALSPTTR